VIDNFHGSVSVMEAGLFYYPIFGFERLQDQDKTIINDSLWFCLLVG